MPEAGTNTESELRQRYGIVILAVLVLAFAGLFVEKLAFDGAGEHGRLIRLATEQQSLVEQTAALAAAGRASTSPDAFAGVAASLKSARDRLMSNHEALTAWRRHGPGSHGWSEELESAYFVEPQFIDRRLRSHVRWIDAILATPYSDRQQIAPESGDEALAAALASVVDIHQSGLRMTIDRLHLLSYSIPVINLVALLLLGIYLFRPVMRRLRDEHQRILDSNAKLFAEVSERQRIALEHASAEAKFRNAFENAPIGMGLMDVEGYVFDANPALKDLFVDETQGLMFELTEVVVDEDREKLAGKMQELVTSAETVSGRLRCTSRAGDELVAVINLSPVLGSDDSIDYVVLQVQDITESHRLNSRLEQQASFDELTGLMNRRAFNREVEAAWNESGKGRAASFLLFMDLDQFKVINDTSGHAAGDQLLRRVSEIISDCVRGDDIVCRLGGDEFGVVLNHCPADVAKRIAETIRADIDSLRFVWGSETYRVGVSIGAAPLDPALGDVNEIQQLVDAACYAAKEAGRNCVKIVSEGKSDARRHRRQIRWVQRIREAMDKNRFAIYGQQIRPARPAPDAPDRVEVLLRLRDPEEKRLIPPGAFLPAAERYGLNVELDEWVVTRLLDMLFVHQSFQADDVRYWVNLSGNSVGDERFATILKDAVRKSTLPPGTINFEVTETAVIRNVSAAGRLMAELQDMGCEMALDDFGSGLSSFGYLKHLPIDYLKIDGMFIKDIDKDPTNRIFVKSIIDIAHSLDIETVAEFVENERVEKIVTELGIDYLQGFGISKPFVLAPKFPERPAVPAVAQLVG